jgi:hypothetical protein
MRSKGKTFLISESRCVYRPKLKKGKIGAKIKTVAVVYRFQKS